jgi:hypothetical protein
VYAPAVGSPPSHTEPEADLPDIDLTTDTRATRDTTEEVTPTEHTRPALRDVAVVVGLFVAYVAALTAIGVFRVVRWPFRHARNQQTAWRPLSL